MRITPSNLEDLPAVAQLFPTSKAANDAGVPPATGASGGGVELNELLARVCEHAATTAGRSLSVLLTPLGTALNLQGDDEVFEFIVSGLLAASHRDRGSGPTTRLGLSAIQTCDELVLNIHGEHPVAASVVQAVTSNGGDGDPTTAHCKRLVEDAGGYLQLVKDPRSPGVSLHLPIEPTNSGDDAATSDNPPRGTHVAVLAC